MVKLGDKVKDKITGCEGIAVAITEFLNGWRRISVQPQEIKDGKPVDWSVFDEPQLEVLETADKGGPKSSPEPPLRQRPL